MSMSANCYNAALEKRGHDILSIKGNYSILKFWVDSFDLEWSNPTGGSSGARATVIKEKGDKAIRPPLVPPKKKPRR